MNPAHDHERFQELATLAEYGELEPAEQRELDAHLEHCAECRAFTRELATDLGRLRAPTAATELPPDWPDRLALRIAPRRRRAAVALVATAAAGLAAGALATLALVHRTDAPTEHADTLAFHRTTPPPAATTAGALSQLDAYLRR